MRLHLQKRLCSETATHNLTLLFKQQLLNTDMEKKILLVVFTVLSGLSVYAQTLEKMNWFNEPDHWRIN